MLGLGKLGAWLRGGEQRIPPRERVLVYGESHPGMVRAENEDAVSFHAGTGSRQGCAFALVADGMGGAQGGAVASRMAAERIPQLLDDGGPASRSLHRALKTVNREIYRRSRRVPELKGMGTTCVALTVEPPLAWAAWVGDSRLYLIRGGRLFQLTEDHSVVRDMVRRGLLTSEQAASHDERNLVTRALGSQKHVEIGLWEQPFPVRAGDRLLLSTDGLHDTVPEAEMQEIAGLAPPAMACGELIAEANRRGGPDNISAVLVEISPMAKEVSPEDVGLATRQSPAVSEVNS
jgi:serine/threonine protein phosphatase PrpC